ncbi:UDP-glucose 4-epimerase GalE [Aliidiomarina celeris]|uniref:UDP-glucose 4-epimerase GalE n=1 Tax=Aliidiomarina celeris TaxID=2249428 RepID=UPI000DE8B87A|nr:UDP-glucose 4-epimerase GalE [Aliidiomarina celeris]
MSILVTGGAGYIGSHTVVQLLEQGHQVVVLDNFSNSSRESLVRVEAITRKKLTLIEGDIRCEATLSKVFADHQFSAVIHFAGLKAVGESVAKPVMYFENNVVGTLNLVKAMSAAGVKRLVFSSSATVYGEPEQMPITELAPTGGTTNPYGTSKYMVERILQDVCRADSEWSISLLRYFNPVGAHESGLIGEDPNGIPNNLVPYVSQVAIGKLPALQVYGNDYSTPDGTGVRDYIHVVDLAKGHLRALEFLEKRTGCFVHNLGTGLGYSVLDMVKAFEAASKQEVPYTIVPRRPGDIAVCYADTTLAKQELGWEAQLGLVEMMRDTWNWQSKNPDGYKS